MIKEKRVAFNESTNLARLVVTPLDLRPTLLVLQVGIKLGMLVRRPDGVHSRR